MERDENGSRIFSQPGEGAVKGAHRGANGARREQQPDFSQARQEAVKGASRGEWNATRTAAGFFTSSSGNGKRCIERRMERDENGSRIFHKLVRKR